MNDRPGGPRDDAEQGRRGLDVDDEPAAEDRPPEDDVAVDRDLGRPAGFPDSAPHGFPDSGDDGPSSEHHRWGDTAYGQAVD